MDGRQLGLLTSSVPSSSGTGAGRGAGSQDCHRRWCSLPLPPQPWASPQAGPNAVLGASRHGHPSRPSPLTPRVALAVLQAHRGPRSGPVPGAATPLAHSVQFFVPAEGVPAAELTWAEGFTVLLFLLLILSNGFLFK